jgi:phospholipid/cholesterol/gamma-HCH transport system substrate-binding protein
METRANYIVTGAFTLAVIVGVFGFIFWFQNTAAL